jgi:DNA gyrase subunit A
MRKSFLDYAMSVIVARALPDVRDGLKPAHRRILYAMYDQGLTPDKPHRKCATTVGEVIGKYHPHGDAAAYDTLVRMAQSWAMRYVLIDGHGNFGSVDGDSAAAYRYTEARLAKIAMELLRDLDKDTVDMVPNFDESTTEPSVLPARYPNLMVNGAAGIAVGMATNIPPHNLGETIDATVALIDDPDATIDDLMKHIKGPDFPTGGAILGHGGIRQAYETGRGSLKIRGMAHIEETTTNRTRIIITELPYQVNKASLVSKIAELVREKKFTEISDLRDESDRRGMRVVIELKQNCIPKVVLNKIYKHTQLETGFGVIMLALVDGVPRTLGLKDMLRHYIDHQKVVIVRRTQFELAKAEARAHILKGLLIALDNLDAVIKTIRGSKDPETAHKELKKNFKLSDKQAQAILDMRLARLTALERNKIEEEFAQLQETIARLKAILKNEKLVLAVIKEELAETRRRFADARRTRISADDGELVIEDLIAEEDMVTTVTHGGYIKRLPVATYRQQRRGGKGIAGLNLKEGDFVEHLFIASTHDHILFFSNKGKVYRVKVHELPLGSRHSRGQHASNVLPFEQDEKIAAVIWTRDFHPDEYLLFATQNGVIKKTKLAEYIRSQRDGIIAISLRDGDELIQVRRVKAGVDILLVSENGQAIRFHETDARAMGRATEGVRGITLKGDDRVLGMEIMEAGADIFVVTLGGWGKRTPVDQYPVHKRGGQGVLTITRHHKKGKLAGVKLVRENHELMLISLGGVVIRVPVTGISRLSRATQGVKIMNLAEDDRICSVARVQVTHTTRHTADAVVEDDLGEPTAEEIASEALADEAAQLELASEAILAGEDLEAEAAEEAAADQAAGGTGPEPEPPEEE